MSPLVVMQGIHPHAMHVIVQRCVPAVICGSTFIAASWL
jgi:hypothetical protein